MNDLKLIILSTLFDEKLITSDEYNELLTILTNNYKNA